MALGSSRGQTAKLILKEVIILTTIGVGIGMVAALALTRLLDSLLFGITPTDFRSFLAAPPILAVISLLSCYIPARRATRVDPLIALRCE